MLKKLRKYQRITMVGFGILLLLTWLAGPAIDRLGKAAGNRKYGSIDGTSIYSLEQMNASREARAFNELGRQIGFFSLGEERDSLLWMLLRHEARAGGYIAEADNGPEMLERLAPALAYEMIQSSIRRVQSGQGGQNDFQMFLRFQQAKPEERQQIIESLAESIKKSTVAELGRSHLNSEEINTALARFFGVRRMQWMYEQAPRVSDRAAIEAARQLVEGAYVDYVTVPASALAASVPDPDEATLQAQFEKYKTVKPGEGEFGIGYFLGPRVKLEFLRLDRKAIEDAVPVDPVEVMKRWKQQKDRYKGEFAADRPAVESDIRREGAERVMREASSAFQREVQKQTRRLETQGRYKALPAEWEVSRPRLEAIAPALVEQVRLATGLTMPAPKVVVQNSSWLERSALEGLPEIGMSSFRQGGITASFADVVFWAKELGGAGPVPVQAGVPVADAFLQGYSGDRFYFNILAVRPESAPDSMGEIREQVLKDYKALQAYERLAGRAEEFRTRAQMPDGLTGIAAEFASVPATPDPAKPEAASTPVPLPIRRDVKVTGAEARDPVLTEPVRKEIVEAARRIDPLTPLAEIPADKASLAVPVPSALSVVVARITRPAPLTIDEYRQNDSGYAAHTRTLEIQSLKSDPFSLEALLGRHIVMVGDRRITTPADLARDNQD